MSVHLEEIYKRQLFYYAYITCGERPKYTTLSAIDNLYWIHAGTTVRLIRHPQAEIMI